MKNKTRVAVLWVVVAILTAGILFSVSRTERIDPKAESGPKSDTLELWLDRLENRESSGREDIKILDSNGKYSYGCLQFQFQTFFSYTKKYGMLRNNEDAEIENWIYDCGYQRQLAAAMIREDYGNWRHWKNSVGRPDVGLPPTNTNQ